MSESRLTPVTLTLSPALNHCASRADSCASVVLNLLTREERIKISSLSMKGDQSSPTPHLQLFLSWHWVLRRLILWLLLPDSRAIGGKAILRDVSFGSIQGLVKQHPPNGRAYLQSKSSEFPYSRFKLALPSILPRLGFLIVFSLLFHCLNLPSTLASVLTPPWHISSLFSWVSVSLIKL